MDDSPVIKALRKQVADLTKLVNNAPTRESIEAEVRAGLARESAISEQLIALNYPSQLSEVLNGKLGEAEVSRESVAAALQGLGFKVEEPDAAQDAEQAPQVNLSDLANVSSLSAQVRSAAVPDHTDLATKLAGAQSQAEITALMAEAGLLTSHTG
jgi:hypothetical protein